MDRFVCITRFASTSLLFSSPPFDVQFLVFLSLCFLYFLPRFLFLGFNFIDIRVLLKLLEINLFHLVTFWIRRWYIERWVFLLCYTCLIWTSRVWKQRSYLIGSFLLAHEIHFFLMSFNKDKTCFFFPFQ